MDQKRTDILKVIPMLILYSIMISMGIFTQIEISLFPVFAIPFALYVVKHRPSTGIQGIFHTIMLVINYFVSGQNSVGLLIYTMSIIIPVGIIVFFYDQELPLPQFIMYVAISLCVIALFFLTAIRALGMDFEQIYRESLDMMKQLFSEATQTMLELQRQKGDLTTEYIQLVQERQQYVLQVLEGMKVFYGYTIVTIVVTLSAITVVIYNQILRCKNKTLPSIKQLLEFRLSKIAVIIFIGATLGAASGDTSYSVWTIIALNLMNILVWFFQIAGGLGLISLLNRSRLSKGFKVLGYIGVIISLGIFPYMSMIFGCLDAFFNYRKVEIVV